ncbi:DUF4097 family beta strand repeat-containing protein [Aestuariibacter sp. AA17]|uniref:DUF4097 family beta strand repeat-containing protein n=1 Tax=Fluctibacter corallii TaxID=2984329 RepID=A0ABT3AD91_9ALTE|nr:DUF4097 family beta strand repeat-containing protein [Aestuariibacter sp. AA17]MCV2886614.1 DUF4097 family beta strand repeat-containing protein [Aestuariibacter sp. AA17]
MKYMLMGIGLFSAAFLAGAGEKIDETLEVEMHSHIKIEHLGGYAKIIGWDKSSVRVVGELGDRTEEFIFRKRGDDVLIKVEVERSRNSWKNWSSDDGDELEIYLPISSSIKYSSTNANVEVNDVQGGANVETVNGTILASKLAGRVRLEAVNGSVEAKDISGPLKMETVNGDIKDRSDNTHESKYETVNGDILVFTRSTSINAETVNGDIEMSLDNIDDLNVDTVNGSIDARFTALNKKADIRASSVGGAISLYFDNNVSARFDIEAHAGGRIINNLTNNAPSKAKYGPRRWLEFSKSGGDASVKVSTVHGRVRIDKK